SAAKLRTGGVRTPFRVATMSALFKIRWNARGLQVLAFSSRMAVLLLPAVLLLGVALRHQEANNLLMWLATGFQAGVCGLVFLSRRSWRQPLGPAVITLYLVGLVWLWFSNAEND